MAESRPQLEPWKPDDELTAVRLDMMRQLTEAAQLTAVGKNVRLYRGVQGGTAIAVDEPPPWLPNRAVAVKILAKVAATHSMYDGEIEHQKSYTPGSPHGETASTVPAVSGVTPCYVMNYAEYHDVLVTATPVHALALGWRSTGVLFPDIGGTGGYDKKPLVIVNGGRGSTLAGDMLTRGATTEGTEAAMSDGWTRGLGPVTFNMVTRVGYWHSGDSKLYAFIRAIVIDAMGCIVSIGTETRVELDAAEGCP